MVAPAGTPRPITISDADHVIVTGLHTRAVAAAKKSIGARMFVVSAGVIMNILLAAFGFMQQMTPDPLLKQLLRYVMSDEARHVAFGVLSLKEYYDELSDAEMLERQEFAFEAAVRMRDRFLQQEVFERMGVPVKEAVGLVMQSPERAGFQAMLFSKIVPNCKKLGLLDAADGWLRTKFTELGVIQFEDWADTGEEYEMFQLAEGEIQKPA